MKPTRHLSSLLFLAVSALLPTTGARAADQTPDAFAMVRASYQADREAKLKEMLQLTETESAAFWPIQRGYRADMEVLGDTMVKLVLEYSDLYPNIPAGQHTFAVQCKTDGIAMQVSDLNIPSSMSVIEVK